MQDLKEVSGKVTSKVKLMGENVMEVVSDAVHKAPTPKVAKPKVAKAKAVKVVEVKEEVVQPRPAIRIANRNK